MRLHALQLSVALVGASLPALAQQPTSPGDPALLTNRRIYGSGEFRSEFFGPARWIGGGAAFTTVESAAGGQGQEIVHYDAESGARKVLVSAAALTPAGRTAPLDFDEYEWSPDQAHLLLFTNTARVWRLNSRGDYWVLDRRSGQLKQIGAFAKPSTLMYAKFSPDGGRVGYVVENNLYVEDLGTGQVTQLTRDGSRTIINGNFDWVYEEELGLHDGWRWSPDGTRIAYWQLNADRVRDFLLVRTTDSLYSYVVPVQYPKAGEENSSARIGVVSAAGGETVWLAFEGDPRNNYLARMDWAASNTELVVQRLNRLQNTNTVFLADATTGAVRPIHVERDSAWVEIVTFGGDVEHGELIWLEGGKSFLWTSERDGWEHVYRISRDGQTQRLLTPGAFDVVRVASVDEKGGWLYYIASPDSPAQRYLWRVRLDGGGKAQRLTPAAEPGTHDYDTSPGTQWAFHTFSSFGVPPTVSLVRLPDHKLLRVLAANERLRGRVEALRRGSSEFTTLKGADGSVLSAWVMKPPGFDSTHRYPVLFYVYGGPGSQTVNDSWGSSTWLWHLLLTQKGYIVASVDNRGTGLRGRDFRKVVHRQLGVIETRDQAAAASDLATRPWVDPSRIGIWGSSYGGFMSLNALFQAPTLYRAAIALAPVTHWKFYDTIYTERYNGLPQDNAAGYDQGSPLTHVGGLRGNLLLIHGSDDDNVHYQNSEVLINALVAADKQFWLMEYPNRTHAISGGNTNVHLREMMTRFLDERLMGTTSSAGHTP